MLQQAPSSLLNRTQKQLKSKTKAIISNVSDTKWWKSQVRWARNLDKPLTLSKAETTGNEREQCRMKYHPFYTPKSDVIMKDFEQVRFPCCCCVLHDVYLLLIKSHYFLLFNFLVQVSSTGFANFL